MAVETLVNKLYDLLVEELNDLAIGYSYNKNRLLYMNELVHALHLLENGDLTQDEVRSILHLFN